MQARQAFHIAHRSELLHVKQVSMWTSTEDHCGLPASGACCLFDLQLGAGPVFLCDELSAIGEASLQKVYVAEKADDQQPTICRSLLTKDLLRSFATWRLRSSGE